MTPRLRRSPRELRDRALQCGAALVERWGHVPAGESLPDHQLAPRLPFGRPTAAALRVAYPEGATARRDLLRRCDDLMAGRFDLLGYRGLDFGKPVDWHLDPVHARRSPRVHWSRVPYLAPEVVGDHKVVWELNRHQSLVTLAQGYLLTGRSCLLNRIVLLLEGWLAENPPAEGINWASSLELSFRAIAWSWTLHLTESGLPLPLRRAMVSSLDLHGRHIERHLSTWFSPNTHLTGEALGLLYLGTAWPAFSRAARWRDRGWSILLEQLPVHIRPDGTYFEQSSWYLAYTVDFYAHALRLARAAKQAVPPGTVERVTAAARALRALIRQDGSVPLIGDDDGGRLLPLGPRPATCFRDTLVHAGEVIGAPDLWQGLVAPPHVVWLVETPPRRDPGLPVDDLPHALPDGGWFFLGGRVGEHRLRAMVDAGPHGSLSGAHAHADPIALDLSIDEVPVLADPGTFSYSGEDRDRFRQTAMHSTLTLAGRDAAQTGGRFRWTHAPHTTVHSWRTGEGFAWLDASHDGWGRVAPGLRHRRGVLWLEQVGLVVLDRLEGGQPSPSLGPEIRWHLAPKFAACHPDAATVVVMDESGKGLRLAVAGGSLLLADATSSSCYGQAQPSQIVIHRPPVGALWDTVVTLLHPGNTAEVRPLHPTGQDMPATWRVHATGITGELAWEGTHLRWSCPSPGASGMPTMLAFPTPRAS